MEKLDVMVCDDSKLARKTLEKLLLDMGVEKVRLCDGGESAIKCYKESRPDIVLLDLIMPNMAGKETLTEIIKIDPKANVIIVSSVGTSSNLKEVLKAGANDFIQKPINEKQLKKILERVINVRGVDNV